MPMWQDRSSTVTLNADPPKEVCKADPGRVTLAVSLLVIADVTLIFHPTGNEAFRVILEGPDDKRFTWEHWQLLVKCRCEVDAGGLVGTLYVYETFWR